MLRTGIPDYRLPGTTIQREIEQILALGVELRLGQRAGADFTVDGLLDDGFSAVFLATGLQRSAPVELPGAELARRPARRRVPARAQPGARLRRSARRSS